MSSSKKRPYRSDLRKAGAAQTRRSILHAARKLFSKRGIEDVGIDEIAREAGVSAPTVYAVFRSKRGILRELMNEARFGDRYEALIRKAQSTRDPVERLRMAASISRAIYDATRSDMELIRQASAHSPEVKRLEREGEKIRFERQKTTVRLLAKANLLAEGLDVAHARDLLWALTGPDIYRMLVIERAWSSDAYEQWLKKELVRALTRGVLQRQR